MHLEPKLWAFTEGLRLLRPRKIPQTLLELCSEPRDQRHGSVALPLPTETDEERDGAMDDLMEAAYEDLYRVARKHLSARFGRDLPGVTLEPAALVNDLLR